MITTSKTKKYLMLTLMLATVFVALHATSVSAEPQITLDPVLAPVGAVVEVQGSGWPPGVSIGTGCVTIQKPGVDPINCTYLDGTVTNPYSNGTFRFELVIPQVPEPGLYTVRVANLTFSAEADFTVKYVAEIRLDPNFDSQGSYVNITGRGFPRVTDTEVELFIKYGESEDRFDEVYTDARGRIQDRFMIPAYADGDYIIVAKAPSRNIEAQADLTIKSLPPMAIVTSEERGEPGETIVLTGIGFRPGGRWKAYLGDVIVARGTVDENGLIQQDGEVPVFRVPDIPPENYTLTVIDWETHETVSLGFEVLRKTHRLLVKATNGTRRLRVPFTLDGVMYTTPEDMRATEGLHMLDIADQVLSRGTLYSFDHWEDGTGATVSLTRSFTYDLQAKTLLRAVYRKAEPT